MFGRPLTCSELFINGENTECECILEIGSLPSGDVEVCKVVELEGQVTSIPSLSIYQSFSILHVFAVIVR